MQAPPLTVLEDTPPAGVGNSLNDHPQDATGSPLEKERVLQKRVITGALPLDANAEIQFSEVFDIEAIQQWQDQFSDALGVASILTAVDGTPITTPSNFTRLCRGIIRNTEVGRCNCSQSWAALGVPCPSGPVLQRCRGGLLVAGANITVGGQHVANWMIGQVRDEAHDAVRMLRYADEIGADRQAFRLALAEVPRMPAKQFERAAQMIFSFARELSNRALQNLQQAGLIHERKQAEKALREAEAFNITVRDSLIENLAVIDAQGVIVMVNQAWQRFAERNNATGTVLNAIGINYLNVCASNSDFPHDEYAAAAREGILAVLNGTKPEFRMDYPCHSRDEERWFQMNVTPLCGSQRGAVIAHLDITDRKQAEERLLRAERLDTIGRLAAGIAHDLNNVLTPIILSAEMLPSTEDPNTRERLISSIAECSQRGADVVHQLLTFARGSRGEHTRVQLNCLVRDVEKIVRETFPRNITVTSSIQPDLWPAKGNPTQIHQVLLNFFINARDAMPKGGSLLIAGENVKVDENFAAMVPDAQAGDYAMLSIADTGTGISRKTIAKIFDPFFTTKEIGKGTGLGLSTVIGIVRNHGGFVTVESKEGHGSTFKVFLPRDTGDAAEQGLLPPLEPPRGKGEMILVVDDEVCIAKTTALVLEKNGYKALTAAEGTEALAVYQEHAHEIKIVLTDVIMPGMGGVQLAKTLQKINPRVKIIASTGQASDSDQSQLHAMGVQVILHKPYDARKLLTTLREAIHSA